MQRISITAHQHNSGRLQPWGNVDDNDTHMATTTTYSLVPQYRHVAHRLAANSIKSNTQHDRTRHPSQGTDNSKNGARNRAANAIAQTSAQDEIAVNLFQKKGEFKRTRGVMDASRMF